MILSLNKSNIDAAAVAAQMVVETHRRVSEFLRVGQTLAQIDAFIAKQLADQKSRSCFLGYSAPDLAAKFPSHACLSLNDCVVHGTAGYYLKPLKEGDLLKIDIGLWHKGVVGDAAWTYCLKTQSDAAKKLMDCGKEAIRRGVLQLKPGNSLLHWAQAVQHHVEAECGLFLSSGLGGHGYGRQLHMVPFVANVLPKTREEFEDASIECMPGMLLAVEPMIAMGTNSIRREPNKWPIYSADGSLTAHYEHDVLVTEDGPRILTEGMENLPDIVG